jgi:hypothetical protein
MLSPHLIQYKAGSVQYAKTNNHNLADTSASTYPSSTKYDKTPAEDTIVQNAEDTIIQNAPTRQQPT